MPNVNLDSKAGKFLAALRDQHPKDSEEKLFERFSLAMKQDAELAEDVARESFRMLCDDLYDEYARDGREIPAALKKPG